MRRFRRGLFTILMTFSIMGNVYAADANTGVIDLARSTIKSYYVDNVSDEVLNKDSVEEIVKGLNDPYSAYFSAKEYSDFVNGINNKFCGIGIHVDIVPEGVKIVSVIDNAPSSRVGLKAGDIIQSADGNNLAGMPSDKAITFIRGEAGTKVKLGILREGKVSYYDVDREEIKLPTVTGELDNGNVGVISINSFGDNTPNEFRQQFLNLKSKSPDYYVIDLRDNGGGYLSTAIDIAGYFIDKAPALKISGKDNVLRTYYSYAHDVQFDKPVIFLTNKYTASASEILSAAVKDYKKAIFIGTTTYGKGVAQSMFTFDDGSVLKLTTERFYSPLGNNINKVGITPDLFVKDEVDSLKVSELLLGNKAKDTNKLKVMINGQEFYLDMDLAKDPLYKDAYDYLTSESIKSGSLSMKNMSNTFDKVTDVSMLSSINSSTSSTGSTSNAVSVSKLLPATGGSMDTKSALSIGLFLILLGGLLQIQKVQE